MQIMDQFPGTKIQHSSVILRNKETAKATHDVAVFTRTQ
jgi:hypothetical protein